MYPFVSIIVPAFNEEGYIRRCLESLINLRYPKERREIILVDNGSTDATKLIAKSYGIKVMDKPSVNVGAVRNYGVQHSQGEIIAFLDGDCIVNEDWLEKGVDAISKNKNCVFGGQYLLRSDPSWLERYWVLNVETNNVHLTTLVGGTIFIKKEHFDRIGGFDEKLRAGEDSDLTERLIAEGYYVEIEPSLSVVHLGYPNTIKSFLKRQMWHSSDYVERLPSSLNDKVFLLTLLFIIGFVFLISYAIWRNSFFLCGVLIVIISPLILSFKRVLRSGSRYYNVLDLVSIYFVDSLYLLGRSIGVIEGVFIKVISLVGASYGIRH